MPYGVDVGVLYETALEAVRLKGNENVVRLLVMASTAPTLARNL